MMSSVKIQWLLLATFVLACAAAVSAAAAAAAAAAAITTTTTTTQNILKAIDSGVGLSTRNAERKGSSSSGSSRISGGGSSSSGNSNNNDLLMLCPNMMHYVFESATPADEAKAGKIEEYVSVEMDSTDEVDLRSCLTGCCMKAARNNTCNVAFVFKRKCYHVQCVSNEACLPKERPEVKGRLQMILVDPVQQQQQRQRQSGTEEEEALTWLDVLKASKSGSELLAMDELTGGISNPLSFWKQPHKLRYLPKNQEPSTYDEDIFPIADKRMKQLLMSSVDDGESLAPDDLAFYNANMATPVDSGAEMKYISCDLEMSELGNRCSSKEECVPIRKNSPTGICKCMAGYIRNHLHECVALAESDYQLLDDAAPRRFSLVSAASEPLPIEEEKKEEISEGFTEEPPKEENNKKLVVSVDSKEVRLPEKEVTLAAFTVPDEQTSNTKYKYLWTLITQPKGPMNGTISDQSESKVKLSNLSEGLYTFKVSVTGDNGTYGETMANVTVLPEARINKVPQVIITPSKQTIRKPTTNAILDGSTSTDDDKIISWHWEVVSGPIGYQPKLPDVNTLQLTDLVSPGNYTFKLTVCDSDNVTNSTTANITVLKETDYPPVANAGDAVILYLPNNNVTLNGTASSDDHEIVAWEWTKDASDETKAVDMQNTRTPYVQLSNLEEGIYTFVLKVTDGSGQSSTAKVHVFVKPPTNTPPIAVAGANMTINLPLNWVTLNGSVSSDDIGIKSFFWKEIAGPNTAVIKNANASISNATSLTLGLYEFELSVVDENNNTATDCLWVKVVQEKNAPPVANAGEDQTFALPLTAIYLNGSNSWDDLAVVKYTWTRDDTSLAAGIVIGDTDKQPVMIVTDLVPGRYVFKLTVSDEQGLTSVDSVTVIVQPDPMLMNLVQITLPMGSSTLTQSELNNIVQKISLLLGDMKIHVRELKYDPRRADATILVFYVESIEASTKTAINGLTIEQLLKEKLQRDATLLGTDFADVRTTVCQNKCSDHGECNEVTRACICEAFWMPSANYFWGLDEANCDWSILYVFVSVIVIFLLLSGLFWGIACACRQSKKPRLRPKSKMQKYSPLGTQDEEAPHFCRATSLSDSETDSDVLFETRTKPNGILRSNGGTLKNNKNSRHHNKYAVTKLNRKAKA